MSQTWQTVLISLLTSLFVSLFTFILGLKSGKNQADRSTVQGIYKKLYAHFDELGEFIKRNRPRTWAHYKEIRYDLNRTHYVPVVSELKMDGDLLYIKPSIAAEAFNLEIILMNYGEDEHRSMRRIHQLICSESSLYTDGWMYEKYNGNDSDAHFKTSNPTNCNSHISADYRDWFDKDRIIELFSHLKGDRGIEFRYQDNSNFFSIMIYPNSFTVPEEEYIEKIYQVLNQEIDDFKEICIMKSTYIKKIDQLERKIAKRVKEPFSFWSTFFGAFADLFR